MKILIVVDMQNDFIYGSLKNDNGKLIVDKIANKIDSFFGEIIFTRDTHFNNYLETNEGKYLPIKHCIKNTNGWEIIDELEDFTTDKKIIDKPSFGSLELAAYLQNLDKQLKEQFDCIESIELCGVCTDICVISNAIILKATFPEIDIIVDSTCCAGTSCEAHNCALESMKSCQIQII